MSKVKITFRGSSMEKTLNGSISYSEEHYQYMVIVNEDNEISALIPHTEILLLEVI